MLSVQRTLQEESHTVTTLALWTEETTKKDSRSITTTITISITSCISMTITITITILLLPVLPLLGFGEHLGLVRVSALPGPWSVGLCS